MRNLKQTVMIKIKRIVKNEKSMYFSAQYLPTVGGVERYTYNIAKQLQKKDKMLQLLHLEFQN